MKNKLFVCSAAIGSALCISSVAVADYLNSMYADYPNQQPPSMLHNGFYIGGATGYGGMDNDKVRAFSKYNGPLNHCYSLNFTTQQNHFAYRANGGYIFLVGNHTEVGPELGFNGYGNTNYDGAYSNSVESTYYISHLKISSYSFDFLVASRYFFGSHFNVLGKAGFALMHQKSSIDYSQATQSGNTASYQKIANSTVEKSKIEPELDAGLGYDINPHVGLNIIYSHTFGHKAVTENTLDLDNVASTNTVLAGMNLKF